MPNDKVMPALSIITVNRNNSNGLRKTIRSVIDQNFSDYEYIIIDGGSDDNSVEVIKEFSSKVTYWSSEPDAGIYNAMNKGIALSKGDYCLFLNSGDYLYNSEVLSTIFQESLIEDLIISSVILKGSDREELFEIPELKSLTFRHFINSTIPHPGAFIKHSLFDKIGCYNEEFLICSDLEFFLIAVFKYGATIRKTGVVTSVYDWNGISSLPENVNLVFYERKRILQNHFPLFLADYEYLQKLEDTNKELEYKINHSFWLMITKVLKNFRNKTIL